LPDRRATWSTPLAYAPPGNAYTAATDADLLHSLAEQPYPFVKQAVAEHPAADSAVWSHVLTSVERSLSQGERPYQIAVELVMRHAISLPEVERLGRLPGASARFRRRLARAFEPSAAPAKALPRRRTASHRLPSVSRADVTRSQYPILASGTPAAGGVPTGRSRIA
jgi:hypothetical protein